MARTQLPAVHEPTHGVLIPSAMPRPPASPYKSSATVPASISVGPSNASALMTALPAREKKLNGVEALQDQVYISNKLDAGTGKRGVGTAETRNVLGRVNPNVAGGVSAISSTSTAGLAKRVVVARNSALNGVATSKAIPRPATEPDVFAPEPPVSSARTHVTGTTARTTSTNTSLASGLQSAANLLGKRSREAAAAPLTVVSKRAKVDAAAAAVARTHRDEHERWLSKWQKAFPTLVFHFEIGAEDGVGRTLRNRVLNMGARIDQFFSQRVSHLVVKGGGSPSKSAKTSAQQGRAQRGSESNPFLDSTGVTDLVQKAEKLGIKVWTVKKLSEMLDKLAPVGAAKGDSLSHMLADEKLHGTRERDFTAPRPDFYYFKPGSKYVLIEDATSRHRPIMVKEYGVKERDSVEWPVLFDHFLRPSSNAQIPNSVRSSNFAKDMRERAWSLYVDRAPFRGEQPPVPGIKRSCSLSDMQVTPSIPETEAYAKASGNSVVITSNIASTSTTSLTPGGFVGGAPSLGANKDRAIVQMSKRVQVLKGNARLAAKGTDNVDSSSASLTPPVQPANRRKSTGMEPPEPPAVKEFLTQAQVVAMLKQLKAPTTMTKPTYDERVRNREHVDGGYKTKDQDTASGYCENCRIRYPNLSVHMASKKHRRFALNPKNFADLDDMLQCLQRPPNRLMCVSTRVCRPCNKLHGKDDECGRCMDDPDLYSSPAPSSSPGSVRKQHMLHCYDEDEEMSEVDDDESEMLVPGRRCEELDEGAEAADRA